MGGRDNDRRGCWCETECGSFFSPLFLLSTFQCPPPRNVGMNTACHPLGGWGSTAVIKKLMPTFNKRWIQCVSDGDGRRRKGGGSLRKLLDGGEGKRLGPTANDSGDLGPAPTSPSTIHSLPPAPLPSRTGRRSPRPSSPSAGAGQSPQTQCRHLWHSFVVERREVR